MRILYSRIDGGVSIVTAAPKIDLEKVLGPLTDDEYKKHVIDKSVPDDVVNFLEVPDDYVFPDREFRNAWQLVDGTITYDLEKARMIQLDRIRSARVPELQKLDIELIKALENGSPIEELKTRRQEMRDITEPLKAMALKSIEDVKKAFPEILLNNH